MPNNRQNNDDGENTMNNDNKTNEDITEKIEIFSTDDEKIKLFGELLTNDSSRSILQLLFKEELTANQIAQKTGISLQLVKYHINKMQELGVIKVSKIEKNSKAQDMKFYSATKFAVVLLPSNVSEKAKESKMLIRSFKHIYKFAGIGVAAVASLFSISLLQESQDAAIKYPRPAVPPYMSPIEPQSGSDESQFQSGEERAAMSESPEHSGVSEFESAPEPEPEPVAIPDADTSSSVIEETLELAKRKIEAGEANPAAGSGTPFFDASELMIISIIIAVIAGGISAYLFWRAHKHSKESKTKSAL